MKQIITIATLILAHGMLGTAPVMADDLYQLVWRGAAYTSDSAGNLRSRPLTESSFIKQVAQDHGLDPATLVFVYRANKRDTAVVRASDGKFIANIIQMEYTYTDAANKDRSVIVRQAFLFDEYHDSAIGSAAGTERARRDAQGNLTSFSFRGTFQYATPEDSTVYAGSFATGRRIREVPPKK